jgi:hypothetical protein
MKVLVCGSRSYKDMVAVSSRMAELPDDTVVIHGDARGVDRYAKQAAERLGFTVIDYPAHWTAYGNSAGVLRNLLMFDEGQPDLVLAFWDGTSRGTAHTIREAEKRGIPVEVFLRHP